MRRGITYPFDLNGSRDKSEIEYIQSGVKAYLDIRYFELMHKPFGEDLENLLFDNIDSAYLDQVELAVVKALKGYSTISVTQLHFEVDREFPNLLKIHIMYYIPSLKKEDFLTYIIDNNS